MSMFTQQRRMPIFIRTVPGNSLYNPNNHCKKTPCSARDHPGQSVSATISWLPSGWPQGAPGASGRDVSNVLRENFRPEAKWSTSDDIRFSDITYIDPTPADSKP